MKELYWIIIGRNLFDDEDTAVAVPSKCVYDEAVEFFRGVMRENNDTETNPEHETIINHTVCSEHVMELESCE